MMKQRSIVILRIERAFTSFASSFELSGGRGGFLSTEDVDPLRREFSSFGGVVELFDESDVMCDDVIIPIFSSS